MVVSGRDRFLNPMRHGGASLVAKLRTFKAAGAGEAPEEATMEAQDRGNGSYAVDCSLKQACDFEVRFWQTECHMWQSQVSSLFHSGIYLSRPHGILKEVRATVWKDLDE